MCGRRRTVREEGLSPRASRQTAWLDAQEVGRTDASRHGGELAQGDQHKCRTVGVLDRRRRERGRWSEARLQPGRRLELRKERVAGGAKWPLVDRDRREGRRGALFDNCCE